MHGGLADLPIENGYFPVLLMIQSFSSLTTITRRRNFDMHGDLVDLFLDNGHFSTSILDDSRPLNIRPCSLRDHFLVFEFLASQRFSPRVK